MKEKDSKIACTFITQWRILILILVDKGNTIYLVGMKWRRESLGK
jgi:hypothetical protein